MLLIALLNILLGAICGLWFRVVIIVPLIAVALGETAFLKRTETWSSAFMCAIALISSLEVGILIGSALQDLWPHSGRGRVHRKHNKLPLIWIFPGSSAHTVALSLIFEIGGRI